MRRENRNWGLGAVLVGFHWCDKSNLRSGKGFNLTVGLEVNHFGKLVGAQGHVVSAVRKLSKIRPVVICFSLFLLSTQAETQAHGHGNATFRMVNLFSINSFWKYSHRHGKSCVPYDSKSCWLIRLTIAWESHLLNSGLILLAYSTEYILNVSQLCSISLSPSFLPLQQ